jgi:hypothetical protein
VLEKLDFSKLSDFEIAMLLIERDCAAFRVERIDELLNDIGAAKGFEDAAKKDSAAAKCELPGSEDLRSLPWKTYHTKEAAKENDAAWIMSNTKGAEVLLSLLKTKGAKVRIGRFDYALSGKDCQFISRSPVK